MRSYIYSVLFLFTACILYSQTYPTGFSPVSYTHLDVYKRQIFMPLAGIITSAFFGKNIFKSQMIQPQGTEEALKQANDMGFNTIMMELGQVNWLFIIPMFLILFVLGYFLYAALCAAIGSAVGDDQAESQQLIMPITLIIVLGLYLSLIHI